MFRRPPADPPALPTAVSTPATDPEAGFSLLEVMVSVVVIGTVMAALTSFFVSANAIAKQQGGSQAGVQIAMEVTERIRALRGSELAKRRDQASTDRQWASPVTAGVAGYLATMEKVYDSTEPALAVTGTSPAALPTTAVTVVRNGISFARHVYLGACWQPANGQVCGTGKLPGYLPFFRVVVAVTWASRQCTDNSCSYVTVTLVSSSPSEPIFNPNIQPDPPVAQNPGAQTGQVGVPLEVQLGATDGSPPLIWVSPTGLPPGLAMDASGMISGSPTAAGTYTWRATVRDDDSRTSSTPSNTWTVRARTLATGPGPQSTISGTAVTVTATVSGGTAPHTWQATNLPPGLAISTAGVITGTPTRPATRTDHSVKVTATDSIGQNSSLTFVWTIIPRLQLDQPATQATVQDSAAELQVRATGGSGTLSTCKHTGLPAGLSITNSCLITGAPTAAPGSYSVTVTATDTGGQTAQRTFGWTVIARFQIEPVGNQVTSTKDDVSLQVRTTGGGGTLASCAASGLPAEVSIDNSCLITGKPKGGDGGSYAVTVTATDSAGKTATASFQWDVVK